MEPQGVLLKAIGLGAWREMRGNPMNWRLKAHALALLSRAPGGRRTYHRLQRWFGSNRIETVKENRKALELIEMITSQGRSLENARVLEIGTGWRPYVPFVLSLAGVERVITVDVNPWLTLDYARETWHSLANELQWLSDKLLVPIEVLRQRHAAAEQHLNDVDRLLEAMRIEYRCPADATRLDLADQSIDAVVSSNVLEHVTPEVLDGIHCEARRILVADGVCAHRIDPEDHFADTDRSITTGNFLQYSDEQWHWYGGSGLAYHNRLRCREHLERLENAGFEVLCSRARIDHPTLEAIQSGELPVDPRFDGFTAEELAADFLHVCGRPQSTDLQSSQKQVDRLLIGVS